MGSGGAVAYQVLLVLGVVVKPRVEFVFQIDFRSLKLQLAAASALVNLITLLCCSFLTLPDILPRC